MKRKNKSLAAFLNFIVWGAGYLYKGEKILFGFLLLAGYILVHLYWFTIGWGLVWTTLRGFTSLIGHLLISTALAYDTYKEKEEKID